MNPHDLLDSHGGLFNNNLGNLLHLDDENSYDEDMDEITFKISEYYDTNNITVSLTSQLLELRVVGM